MTTAPKPTARRRAAPKADAANADPNATQAARRAARTDKADRPSPPDRDGDGKSGGSRAGNATDDRAKGTADSALAHKQLETQPTATIKLEGMTTGSKGHHPLGVNGKIRNIPVNVECQVNADELAALEASHLKFTVVTPLPETAEGEGSASGSAEPSSHVEIPGGPTPDTDTSEGTGSVTQKDPETIDNAIVGPDAETVRKAELEQQVENDGTATTTDGENSSS